MKRNDKHLKKYCDLTKNACLLHVFQYLSVCFYLKVSFCVLCCFVVAKLTEPLSEEAESLSESVELEEEEPLELELPLNPAIFEEMS